jgi:regulator of protease activity HflC (stomatin/prohibitin superfamily)
MGPQITSTDIFYLILFDSVGFYLQKKQKKNYFFRHVFRYFFRCKNMFASFLKETGKGIAGGRIPRQAAAPPSAFQRRHFSKSFHISETNDAKIRSLMQDGRFVGATNHVVHFVPEGSQLVIERFGRFHSVRQSGITFLLPFLDRIAYVVDSRLMCFIIDPKDAYTKDNVSVEIGANLFVQFNDARQTAYGSSNPVHSVIQLAQSIMRSSVGELKLDQLNSERSHLSKQILSQLAPHRLAELGAIVHGFEISSLKPTDAAVRDAMHNQATAERERLAIIITAEARKKQTELEADAYYYRQTKQADADAKKTEMLARSQAESIRLFAQQLSCAEGQQAAAAFLSEKYFETLKVMGSQAHSTIIVPQTLSDISSVVTSAKALVLGAAPTGSCTSIHALSGGATSPLAAHGLRPPTGC